MIALTLALALLMAACGNGATQPETAPPGGQAAQPPQQEAGGQEDSAEEQAAEQEVEAPEQAPPRPPELTPQLSQNDHPLLNREQNGPALIFVEETTGADDGMARLVSSMQEQGVPFHQTAENPEGLIAANDVVIIKINAQWAERGGTNTDLIRLVTQAIVDHPEGFGGEVVVADNGQAQFGSAGRGGSLEWQSNNAIDINQSVMHVVGDFQAEGHQVTGVLWDRFTRTRVSEFSEGDYINGFVVEEYIHHTGIEISYPKFTTEFGTHISFREGIWDSAAQSYDSQRLKIINMPVLKSHMLFQVTGAVKNYMGTPSDFLTSHRAHLSTGTGGMGTQMAFTRMPVLNIMDMIWIGPERGPANPHYRAEQMNLIAASLDPVALDWWTTRNVLMPVVDSRPGGRAALMDPDGGHPGTFGHWLRLSKIELQAAGFAVTMEEANMQVIGSF